jgi:hypothetical protein
VGSVVPPGGGYQCHDIVIPVLGDEPITIATLAGTKLVWFPVNDVCERLGIDYQRQWQLLNDPEREMAEFLASVPFPSSKGERSKNCIELEGIGGWVLFIQSRRVAPAARDRLRFLQKQARDAVSAIFVGYQPVLAASPRRTYQRFIEERVASLESVVFVEGAGAATRAARCPHCGEAITIQVGSLRVVPGEE